MIYFLFLKLINSTFIFVVFGSTLTEIMKFVLIILDVFGVFGKFIMICI